MLNFENEGNLVAIIVNKDKDKNKNKKSYMYRLIRGL